MNDTNDQRNVVALENDYIVLEIPASTLEVKITAKVWHEGEVIEVTRTMSFEEVKEAFKEAEEGYMPSDAVFTLTEKGRMAAERLGNEVLADSVAKEIIGRMGVED